jgi:hypothetical protein
MQSFSYLPRVAYKQVRSRNVMIHFIVAIQQAIQTQKKVQKEKGDQQKKTSQQNGEPLSSPPTEQHTEPPTRRQPFWKRWFTSGR